MVRLRADEARPERPRFSRLAKALEEEARLAEESGRPGQIGRSLAFHQVEAKLQGEQDSHSPRTRREKRRGTLLVGVGVTVAMVGVWAGLRLAPTEAPRPISSATVAGQERQYQEPLPAPPDGSARAIARAEDEALDTGRWPTNEDQPSSPPPELGASEPDAAASPEVQPGDALEPPHPSSMPDGVASESAKLAEKHPQNDVVEATPSDDDRLSAGAYDQAYALQQERRFEEALAQYRLALAAEPRAPHVLYGMATVLSRLGQLDEAAAVFERAAAAAPTNPFIFYDWGWVLERSGDLSAAREKYRRALSVGEGTTAAENAQARLAVLAR